MHINYKKKICIYQFPYTCLLPNKADISENGRISDFDVILLEKPIYLHMQNFNPIESEISAYSNHIP